MNSNVNIHNLGTHRVAEDSFVQIRANFGTNAWCIVHYKKWVKGKQQTMEYTTNHATLNTSSLCYAESVSGVSENPPSVVYIFSKL
jgi:hypothetical protein